jgi:LysM repeat protein
MGKRQHLAATAVVGADALALATLRPSTGRLERQLAHPHAWVSEIGADRALAQLAGAALWLAAAWLALGLLATAGIRLPGAAGRCSAYLSRALLPRAVRGLLAGSAGLGVLLTPVAAGAATPPVPTPVWPSSPVATQSAPASVPPPVWPTSSAPSSPAPSSPAPSPARPTPAPPRHPPAPTRPAPVPHTSDPSTVRVRAGDSLWLITARRLGPDASPVEVAAEWPRWYAANKQVVGADPAVIKPGQLLHAPSPTPAPKEATP